MIVKLDAHTCYVKMRTVIVLQGQGSKVKVMCLTLLYNLENKIKAELFG